MVQSGSIAVIAGSHSQYKEFLDWFRYSAEETKKRFFYVNDERDILGKHEIAEVFCIGSYRDRTDWIRLVGLVQREQLMRIHDRMREKK